VTRITRISADYGHRSSLNRGIGYAPNPLYSHPCNSVCTVIRTTKKSLNTNHLHANRIVTVIPVAAHLPRPQPSIISFRSHRGNHIIYAYYFIILLYNPVSIVFLKFLIISFSVHYYYIVILYVTLYRRGTCGRAKQLMFLYYIRRDAVCIYL